MIAAGSVVGIPSSPRIRIVLFKTLVQAQGKAARSRGQPGRREEPRNMPRTQRGARSARRACSSRSSPTAASQTAAQIEALRDAARLTEWRQGPMNPFEMVVIDRRDRDVRERRSRPDMVRPIGAPWRGECEVGRGTGRDPAPARGSEGSSRNGSTCSSGSRSRRKTACRARSRTCATARHWRRRSGAARRLA